jgi:16S rRNA (adenine1518-N6/adenine1519-N6)-dimethyltransferase
MSFIRAKKAFGQNFCIDESLTAEIMEHLKASASDEIWEIGPGKGALTKYLMETGANLWLYEIDHRMHEPLKAIGVGQQIVWNDFLDIPVDGLPTPQGPLLVCGNLPYYCATPIIRQFLEDGPKAERLVFLLQREVAEKAAARVGDKNYSYLSLHTAFFAHARLGNIYKPESFRPMPKIDSRILILEPLTLSAEDRSKRQNALDFASVLFGQRRKMALPLLKKQFAQIDWESLFEKQGIDAKARPENISPEQMLVLFN